MHGGRVTVASRCPPACRTALAAAAMPARSSPVSASPRSAGIPAAMLAARWSIRRCPAAARQGAAVEGGDRGVPADDGYCGLAGQAGRDGDERAGEVAADQPGLLADQQPGAGLGAVQAGRADPQPGRQHRELIAGRARAGPGAGGHGSSPLSFPAARCWPAIQASSTRARWTPGSRGTPRTERSARPPARCSARTPAPVAHLGIDEHRRSRPSPATDELTGENVQLADRWHVCFYDLDGSQGLLGQVEGRTADDTAYWLAGATPAWRDAVQVVAIDMCTIFASAVRRMLPRAQVAADLFHVVQLAVKTVGDVRRRAIRERYGRRGKAGDPEYGIKHLLERNLENLSPDNFEKIIGTLDASAEGQQIAITWIAKEKLRDALKLRARVTGSTPCERQVRDKLFSFYDWLRAARGHPRAPDPREHHRTLGKRDRHRRCHRRHQRDRRKPQPPRQTRSPPRLRLPQPRKPAPPRPHRLHPRHPATACLGPPALHAR